jgi:NADH dehydrogenase FAD-containing subunit
MNYINNMCDLIRIQYNRYNLEKQENKKKVILLGDGFFARGFLHTIDYSKYDITQIYKDKFINPQDIFYGMQRNKTYEDAYHFRDLFQKKITKIKEDINTMNIINKNSVVINNKIHIYDYLVVGLGSHKSLKQWSGEINDLVNNLNIRKNIAIVGMGLVGLELGMILNKNHKIDMFDMLNEEKILSYVNSYHKEFILESMKNNNITINLEKMYNNKEYNHDKIIFCVGNKCNSLTKSIQINDKLQSVEFNNVYIGGDSVDSIKYIKNAQCAYQQGVYVAKRLNGTVNEENFHYESKGISLNVDDKQILVQDHKFIPNGIYPDFMIKMYSFLFV